MYKIALVTVAFGALLINIQPAPAACHHYSIWKNPYPQPKCGLAARGHTLPQDTSYYVEIGMPNQDTIPLPILNPLLPKKTDETPAEPDQRTPEQILDREEHDQAVQDHENETNKLMIILHAQEVQSLPSSAPPYDEPPARIEGAPKFTNRLAPGMDELRAHEGNEK